VGSITVKPKGFFFFFLFFFVSHSCKLRVFQIFKADQSKSTTIADLNLSQQGGEAR
jgi:hypothetical protein